MAAPRLVLVAFLVLLSLLGLCSSYRPLPAARGEDNNGTLISKNDDGELEAVVIGTELCGENECSQPKPPDFGGRESCEPPYGYVPPVVVVPLPPVIIPPLPPPIEVEPCLPPLPSVIVPLPPVIVEPPTDCPVPAPCSDGCTDLQGQEYDDNAVWPAAESQPP